MTSNDITLHWILYILEFLGAYFIFDDLFADLLSIIDLKRSI